MKKWWSGCLTYAVLLVVGIMAFALMALWRWYGATISGAAASSGDYLFRLPVLI